MTMLPCQANVPAASGVKCNVASTEAESIGRLNVMRMGAREETFCAPAAGEKSFTCGRDRKAASAKPASRPPAASARSAGKREAERRTGG